MGVEVVDEIGRATPSGRHPTRIYGCVGTRRATTVLLDKRTEPLKRLTNRRPVMRNFHRLAGFVLLLATQAQALFCSARPPAVGTALALQSKLFPRNAEQKEAALSPQDFLAGLSEAQWANLVDAGFDDSAQPPANLYVYLH